MSKKIAVLITDEFEDSEFTSPAAEFRQAGHEVITIEKEAGKTVKGKKARPASPLIRRLMTFVPTSSTPCYCRGSFAGLPARRQPFRGFYPRFR